MKCNTMQAPLFWFPLLQTFELSHERWGRLLCFSLLLLDYQRLKPERARHHAVHWIAQRPNVEDSVASCGEKTHGKQMNIHISLLCAACGNDATHPSFSSPTTNCNHNLSGDPPRRRRSISKTTPGAVFPRRPSPSGRDSSVVHFGFCCHTSAHIFLPRAVT